MTELERLGEEALERGQRLLAKAKSALKDLDKDFEDLEDPDLPEDLEEPSEVDEEERDDEDDEDVKMHRYEDQGGDEDEEEEDEEEKPVAKAVDALPILAAIEKRLRALEAQEKRLQAQEKRLQALVKAVGSLVQGVEVLAKGYASLANTPKRPKAHQVVVPTGRKEVRPGEVLAKALQVVKDPIRVGIMEHYANRGDLEGLLSQLSPEERAKILGGE